MGIKEVFKNLISNITNETETIIEVVCTGYDEVTETFSVIDNMGNIKKISKDNMSIYNLNPKSINDIVNKTIKVISKNSILSRKALMEKRLNELTASNPINKIIEVEVISASNSALYVDMGYGVNGIIYKSDLTAAQISRPIIFFPIGSKLNCKIMQYRDDKKFFVLSYKDMFSKDMSQYKNGMKLEGIICAPIHLKGKIVGYFVEITPAISGIIDVNNILLQEGEKLPMVIHDVTKKGLKLRFIFPS